MLLKYQSGLEKNEVRSFDFIDLEIPENSPFNSIAL